MDLSRLAKTDLNLLVSLNALLDHCSVSQAAASLHLTQSAMSKTLTRLRACSTTRCWCGAARA